MRPPLLLLPLLLLTLHPSAAVDIQAPNADTGTGTDSDSAAADSSCTSTAASHVDVLPTWEAFLSRSPNGLGKTPFVIRRVPGRVFALAQAAMARPFTWDAWTTDRVTGKEKEKDVDLYPYWVHGGPLEGAARRLAGWSVDQKGRWKNVSEVMSVAQASAKCGNHNLTMYALGTSLKGQALSSLVLGNALGQGNTTLESWFLSCLAGKGRLGTRSHYDLSDNLFLQVRGTKRVVLSPPETAMSFYIAPTGHPEHRQSQLSPASLEGVSEAEFPHFFDGPGGEPPRFLEVELGPGDLLFIPQLWIHLVTTTAPLTLSVAFRQRGEQGRNAMSELIDKLRQLPMPFEEDWSLDTTTRFVAAFLSQVLGDEPRALSLFAARWRVAFKAPRTFTAPAHATTFPPGEWAAARTRTQAAASKVRALCLGSGEALASIALFQYADDVVQSMFVSRFGDAEAVRFASVMMR